MSSPIAEPNEAGPSRQDPPTFLFDIRKLDVDGEIVQCFLNNHWIPPKDASAFTRSDPTALYRWTKRSITEEEGCVCYEGCWWVNQTAPRLLETFKSQSVFWSGNSLGFLTAPNDVSIEGLEQNDPPQDEWQQLNFIAEDDVPGLSRIVDSGELHLFGTGARWIKELGMSLYDEKHHYRLPKAAGLVGNLATLIAIIAFSCEEEDLGKVLLKDKAWHKGKWKGHRREHGRDRERGMVVNIYLDPRNPSGSTHDALYGLEWGNEHILVY